MHALLVVRTYCRCLLLFPPVLFNQIYYDTHTDLLRAVVRGRDTEVFFVQGTNKRDIVSTLLTKDEKKEDEKTNLWKKERERERERERDVQ